MNGSVGQRRQKRVGRTAAVATAAVVIAIGAVVARAVARGTGCVTAQSGSANCSFFDTQGNPLTSAIANACNASLITPCGDPTLNPTYFCPGEFVPRDDMAVLLAT